MTPATISTSSSARQCAGAWYGERWRRRPPPSEPRHRGAMIAAVDAARGCPGLWRFLLAGQCAERA